MDAYTTRLSEYIDDEGLDSSARAELETHLQSCLECRAVLADLRGVAARAGALTDARPSDDLWPGIAARIAPAPALPFKTRTARRISFTVPQLVAASLALMLLSGTMVWVSRIGGTRTDIEPVSAADRSDRPGPVEASVTMANFADTEYDQAVADLQKALSAGRESLDPQTVRVLEENLQAIDRAIEQSRQALSKDPANLYLNTHLAAARKRKLSLLRSATALAAKG
jgi:tetratricopeptide (TPR) repeat protein